MERGGRYNNTLLLYINLITYNYNDDNNDNNDNNLNDIIGDIILKFFRYKRYELDEPVKLDKTSTSTKIHTNPVHHNDLNIPINSSRNRIKTR